MQRDRKMKKLKLKEDEAGNKVSDVRGIRAACKVMKTRYAKPFEAVQVKIPYETGMDPYSGLLDLFEGKGLLVKQGNRLKYTTSKGEEMLEFRKGWTGEKLDLVISEYSQKPWFIPESTRLDNQLLEFKRRKEHFSIVVDEYGEFLGIVTLEDIIEEIVGDIDDELDDLKLSKNENGIKETSKNHFLVNGTVNIRDLNKQIGTDLPINNASTVAGLILYESRIIPKKGQVFSFFGLKFKILSKKNNQLLMLKISKNN